MAMDVQAQAEVVLLTVTDAEEMIAGMKKSAMRPADIEFFAHALELALVAGRVELLVVIKGDR